MAVPKGLSPGSQFEVEFPAPGYQQSQARPPPDAPDPRRALPPACPVHLAHPSRPCLFETPPTTPEAPPITAPRPHPTPPLRSALQADFDWREAAGVMSNLATSLLDSLNPPPPPPPPPKTFFSWQTAPAPPPPPPSGGWNPFKRR